MLMRLLIVVIVMITCYYCVDVEGTLVMAVPVIVNDDGHPLGVSVSQARDVVALDGHVFVALRVAVNDTLMLKITPLEGLIDKSFTISRVAGEELGSGADCLYQVTVVGDDGGQGLLNLCDNLVSV